MGDVYGQRYGPSAESLGGQKPPYPDSTAPNPEYPSGGGLPDSYPAWTTERQIPLSKEEIEDIFLDLSQKFGFQRDSMRNMVRRVLSLLDVPLILTSSSTF